MLQSDYDRKVRPYGIVRENIEDHGTSKRIEVWVLGTLRWLEGCDGRVEYLDQTQTLSGRSETKFTVWVNN